MTAVVVVHECEVTNDAMWPVPLHDAVGINCKKGATTENQGADVKYMSLGVYIDVQRVLSDLT